MPCFAEGPGVVARVDPGVAGVEGGHEGPRARVRNRDLRGSEEAVVQIEVGVDAVACGEPGALLGVRSEKGAVEQAVPEADVVDRPVRAAHEAAAARFVDHRAREGDGGSAAFERGIPGPGLRPADEPADVLGVGGDRSGDVQVVDVASGNDRERSRVLRSRERPVHRERVPAAVELAGPGGGLRRADARRVVPECDVGGHRGVEIRLAGVHASGERGPVAIAMKSAAARRMKSAAARRMKGAAARQMKGGGVAAE